MSSIPLRCLLAFLLHAAGAPAGHAQTFHQCLSPQGRPEFSAKPCAGRTPSGPQAERINTFACQGASRSLEVAANATRPNPETVRARRSAMHGACAMKAPPEVTIIHPSPAPPAFRRP